MLCLLGRSCAQVLRPEILARLIDWYTGLPRERWLRCGLYGCVWWFGKEEKGLGVGEVFFLSRYIDSRSYLDSGVL